VAASLQEPILNSPYDEPDRHFAIGPHGPTGEVRAGRRASESFIPIPQSRKRGAAFDSGFRQEAADFDVTGERREENTLINDLRREVERWRHRGYDGATATSKKLMTWWSDPGRGEDRVFFCQREAAETAIFLAEVAGRHGYGDWRRRLEPFNAEQNDGLPRFALKMATGTGKTVVMAMLIAWQVLNKVASPRDARFARNFLIVTPGITIRDRLRVLQPSDPGNYYAERDLVPPELVADLRRAQVVVRNYHAFLPREATEVRGVAKTTKELLRAGRKVDPFTESPAAVVSRVLRDFGSDALAQPLVVFSDEAHHCYQDRPVDGSAADSPSKEERDANDEARVWFRGVREIAARAKLKAVYDLSATPYYLKGSGYPEGYIFPWTVSDFSLMDAIESGIVKIPRLPVDDDATGDLVTYLRLWDHVGDQLPRRRSTKPSELAGWVPPKELEGALLSLYRSYRRSFERWESSLAELGEPPPVFIVVCPNTVVSKLVYDWIAGGPVGSDTSEVGTTSYRAGRLDLLSNVVDGAPLARPRTILVDSAQLESGDKLSADFKQAAADEIDAFKAEYRLRHQGADAEAITDEDLLREVMNTVGKRGTLGEPIRCVVSVAMLTEGWDANTVTHILGIRAFRSQLLCEQVVGRGLRRRSYALNDDGRLDPEYASVYGIPFAFLPSDKPISDPKPASVPQRVATVPGREDLRIEFPRLVGYRVEIPDEQLHFDAGEDSLLEIGPSTVPTTTDVGGIVGAEERVQEDFSDVRRQRVAYELAKRLLDSHFAAGAERRPWLFPRLAQLCSQWIDECVTVVPPYGIGWLMLSQLQADAADRIYASIVRVDDRRARLRPMLRPVEAVGSTGEVHFLTHKATVPTEKSEVSHVVLDGGGGGNTWEQLLAAECELSRDVASYVKNDHLGFAIPYVHQGRTHSYMPDFLLRLRRRDGDVQRVLIVEVSGGQKSPGPTKVKAETARDSWCVAVNNHGGFGRWGYVEITEMVGVRARLGDAIAALYDDAPVIGDPELRDFDQIERPA
jgi:type III restriction enzyme